ncbi:hypothetical protein M231_04332 [Tremella mesenterica]|uniref:Uncharacterized protein n=1 Tax=Tremella mesenterica TaxID=5217 RepID=A0A4Q1BKX4_TREME|nr:hypothetical protein M231_04332 [Tremella mesenterica]
MSSPESNFLRETPRPRRLPTSSPPHHPLVTTGTITFIASWRGQLLVCTTVLLVGVVWFVIQQPLAHWKHERREHVRRIRERELMLMEEHKEEKPIEIPRAKERGREKKKESSKRRKTSLLRGAGGDTSTAHSPSPMELSPVRPPIAKSPPKPAKLGLPKTSAALTVVATSAPAIHLRAPTDEKIRRPLLPSNSTPPTTPDPWEIPLPDSPVAGPSRINTFDSSDGMSFDDSASMAGSTRSGVNTNSVTDGWSIMPEEGYLPPSVISPAKKKKRKSKVASTTSVTPEPISRPPSTSIPALLVPGASTPSKMGSPRKQSRTASLARTGDLEIDSLLDERDKTIDGLRAEIGLAKATEAKASDAAQRARATEERLRYELDRAKRSQSKADTESRRREAEMSNRITQMSQMYSAAIVRLSALENLVRDAGRAIPPPTPSVPMNVPPHLLHPTLSLGSPYNTQFTGSPGPPGRNSPMYLPYPSPGMYPSPMLHPHFQASSHHPHPHSPSPYRQSSMGNEEISLAGPLTPGQGNHPGSGMIPSPSPNGLHTPYPPELGLGVPNPSGLSPADLRRLSIESSVLKKKALKEGSDSGDSRPEPILEHEHDPSHKVEGLGMGTISIKPDRTFTGPTFGNPPSQKSCTSSPSKDQSSSPVLHPESNGSHFDGIKVISSAKGNVYALVGDNGSEGSMDSLDVDNPSSNTSMTEPPSLPDILGPLHVEVNPDGKQSKIGGENGEEGEEEFEPMFASLAHTPAQVAEIARLSEAALNRNRVTSGEGPRNGIQVGI